MIDFNLTIPVTGYIVRAAVIAFFVRALICAVKASGRKSGEHGKPEKLVSWWRTFLKAFSGFSDNNDLDDYWLPFLIGLAELVAYPVLLKAGKLEIIGAWLALKTAGSWKTWANSRTAFNRFLVFNLLTLGICYFYLSRFVN